MIKKVEIKRFKRFKETNFVLKEQGVTILAGGNNSGKSSLLHALAVWEFCKTYILFEKGKGHLLSGFTGQGIGIGLDDFSPISVPSLKYLWTNLKPKSSYTLSIKCFWNSSVEGELYLKIGLAYAQEKIFVKMMESNLTENSVIPTIAYLPPFAGISDKETWFSVADRRRMIGKGLAGAVLRNTIMEMFDGYWVQRRELQGNAQRISTKNLQILRETNSFEKLNQVLFRIFQSHLIPHPFNQSFHNYVRVDVSKGTMTKNIFRRYKGFNNRDIMVEGSGFLQWLSVYTYALNEKIDVLLLDEPDAHLHCSLQTTLLKELEIIAHQKEKQILLASHSTEIIKEIEYSKLLKIEKNKGKYLEEDNQKIGLLAGLGTPFSPMLNKLQKYKNVIFVENESDFDFIKIWADKLGMELPKNLVVWGFANKHQERKYLVKQLKEEIDDDNGRISGLSLVDRDDNPINDTAPSLRDTTMGNGFYDEDITGGQRHTYLRFRKWRRRYIENYLLSVPSIARAINKSETEVEQLLLEEFGLTIPPDATATDMTPATENLFRYEAKQIFEYLEKKYGVNKFDVAKQMEAEEIYDDVKTLIDEIVLMCG